MRGYLPSVTCLAIVLTLAPFQIVEAQSPQQDASHWRAYARQMKPKSTVKLRLHNGERFEGRLLDTTAEDMGIRMNRLFRRGENRRVRYDAVETLVRTHPTGDQVLGVGVGMGGALLLIFAMLGGFGRA
jgi:hypothetical protein